MEIPNTITLSSVAPLPSEATAKRTQWVALFRSGRNEARDGRVFHVTDANAIIAASLKWAGATDLVVDFEHQTERAASNGQPAPAAGWIKKLEARRNLGLHRMDGACRQNDFCP